MRSSLRSPSASRLTTNVMIHETPYMTGCATSANPPICVPWINLAQGRGRREYIVVVTRRPGTIEIPAMRFFWALVFVAAAAGGIYLADRMVLAPSRAMQRQLAEKDAEIRALTERNQALEAAIRLLRYAERRARPAVLEQAHRPQGHPRNALRFRQLELHGHAD